MARCPITHNNSGTATSCGYDRCKQYSTRYKECIYVLQAEGIVELVKLQTELVFKIDKLLEEVGSPECDSDAQQLADVNELRKV